MRTLEIRIGARSLLATLIVFTACALAEGTKHKIRQVPPGVWGGEHIRLEVGEQTASVEYDCAHGVIKGPLVVNSHGNFNLEGTHAREHGGPVRRGESVDTHPALYSGSINGRQMKLTVVLKDTKESVGTFTLVRGENGHIWKCR